MYVLSGVFIAQQGFNSQGTHILIITQTMQPESHFRKKYINKYKQCPPGRSRNIQEHCPLEDNYCIKKTCIIPASLLSSSAARKPIIHLCNVCK